MYHPQVMCHFTNLKTEAGLLALPSDGEQQNQTMLKKQARCCCKMFRSSPCVPPFPVKPQHALATFCLLVRAGRNSIKGLFQAPRISISRESHHCLSKSRLPMAQAPNCLRSAEVPSLSPGPSSPKPDSCETQGLSETVSCAGVRNQSSSIKRHRFSHVECVEAAGI